MKENEIDSKWLSDKLKKRHDHVLRDIHHLNCTENFISDNFVISKYITRGKYYPKYIIKKEGLKLLLSRYRGVEARKLARELGFEIVRQDTEGDVLSIISDTFNHLDQKFQFNINGFRIDLYLPEIKLAI